MPELLKAMINANPNIFNGPSGRFFVFLCVFCLFVFLTNSGLQRCLIAHTRFHQFNHANQTQVAPICKQSSSPCGQNAPQGSPASPASARLPAQRPSVITEQKPVANCHNVNISQSESSNQNAQLGANQQLNPTTDSSTTDLRQHRRPVRGTLPPTLLF